MPTWGELILEINESATEPDLERPASPSVTRQLQVWQRPGLASVVALALVVLGGLAVWSLTRPEPATPPPPTRLSVGLPPGVSLGIQGMTVSPDGRTLVVEAQGEGGSQLYRRTLGSLEVAPIPGTEGAGVPFFSPDGAWIGFFAGGALRKVSLDGRPPVTLCEVPGLRAGASWGPDDTVVYSYTGANGLWRVSANGGDPEPIPRAEADTVVDLRWPNVLPDGSAALVTAWTSSLEDAQIGVVALATGELEILLAGSFPRYSPTGHLVYWREDSLWAAPFDAARHQLIGPAAPVVEGVGTNPGGLAHFGLASAGTLAYWPGGGSGNAQVPVWVDREGREEPVGASPRRYAEPRQRTPGTSPARY